MVTNHHDHSPALIQYFGVAKLVFQILYKYNPNPNPNSNSNPNTIYPGQERVDLLTGQFYKGTDAIIFVYDITDSRTLWHSDKWIQDWQLHIGDLSSLPILFVGNKNDSKHLKQKFMERSSTSSHDRLDDDDDGREDEGEEEEGKKDIVDHSMVKVITKSHNFLGPLECSAKTGEGVNKVFERIARELAMVKPSKPWKCICL